MIHKFKQLGYNIVLDVNSGAVHLPDDCAYDMLDYIDAPMSETMPSDLPGKLPQYSENEVCESYAELYQLYKDGALFAEDDYEKYSDTMVKSPVKSMCLNVSHDCNLRCEYCFAQQGDFGGERCIMTPETGRKAIDEKIAYINKEMSNCVLSLDGRREVTDRIRKTVNGKSCFDIIVPKFQKLVQSRGTKDYYVRATFTKYNLDFTDDILAMRDLGFVQLSAEPVVTDPTMPYALNEEDLPRVFSEYDKLCDIMAERTEDKFNFFHFMVDLNAGPCAIKRLRGCGCGNDYVAVEPHGDIYPCHQFVGIEQWKMGNLYDGTFNDDIKTYFSKVHVYSKEGCRSCWAKFFCSGGCNANSFIYEGDVKKPYKIACEMQKKRLECAIALAADRAVKGQEAPSMSEAPASMG